MSLKVREILAKAKEKLYKAGIEEAGNDSWLLFEYIFEMDRTHYFLKMEEEISDIKNGLLLYEKYKEAVLKRSRHVPLQYITGHQIFMGIDFEVNENVLIPRQDTEILAEQALKICEETGRRKEAFNRELYVLDMCTGSGCIAVSVGMLSKRILNITAVDISEKALWTARKNAEKNHCRIEFIQSDLFQNLGGRKFDVIISNPPYIKSKDIPALMEEVRDYEPRTALDGDADGLSFYRKISNSAGAYLNDGGYLLYEIGCGQAEDVTGILEKNGFVNIRILKDLAELNRIVTAEYKDCKIG